MASDCAGALRGKRSAAFDAGRHAQATASIIGTVHWHLFCRIVDNFGDIGFAWRLAADLASRGERVRLAVDDASALAWLAPNGAEGVSLAHWQTPVDDDCDVIVETFGCGFPQHVDDRSAATPEAPLRIDVEHLSAEGYVERSHGLASPLVDSRGVESTTWFFFPGFNAKSGGLLREAGLLATRRRFDDGAAWLASHGIQRRPGERCVSLFCYAQPNLDRWLTALADEPTLLLATPGFASDQVVALLGRQLRRGSLRACLLPAFAQADFDRLLWSCDLNLVRGEDSFVRALWAGVPFVWQLYPQDDGAHLVKLDAFLTRFLAAVDLGFAGRLQLLFADWNGAAMLRGESQRVALPLLREWAQHCTAFRDALASQVDLTASLIRFAASKR